MGIFSWATLTTVVAIAYIAITVQKLYTLMNPLYGVEITENEPLVSPIWKLNQTFSMVCYMSSNQRPTYNISQLSKTNSLLLWEKHDLVFNKLQKEISYDIKLIHKTYLDKNNLNSISNNNDTHTLLAPTELWSKLRKNQSSVFLHVLVTMNANDPQNDDLSRQSKKQWELLYGSVRLVKYDVIPKIYRHRYLLSDFGWVNITADEGKG